MTQIAFEEPETDIEAECPITPVGWRVVLRPYRPPKKFGQIELADETIENEELLTYVGQVVAMGSECYKAVTRSGINLAEINPKPKVGDWVIYGTYGGQTVRTKAGVKFLVMNDDGIMAIVAGPDDFKYYL